MSKALKIIFAGTPDFAVPSLQALIESSHQVIAVYCQPDRPKGRGKKLAPCPVKALALRHDIPVFQPKSLKASDPQADLSALQADMMVVAAYGLLLPKAVLDIPSLGCINVHASLLPRWRGASPIQQSILHGDDETGVTIMQMDVGLDTGDMLLKEKCAITATDSSQTLHDKLAQLGAKALLEVLTQIQTGQCHLQRQDDSLASYAGKIAKEDGRIDWSETAALIERKIRAYNPWPVAYTMMGDLRLRVFEAEVLAGSSADVAGEILRIDNDGILVACGKGQLLINQLQLPGAKRMAVKDCLNAKAALFAEYSHLS